MNYWLTANDVRNATFSKPPLGYRGYNKDEVNAFMDLVAARLEGRGRLTAADIHNVAFGKPELFKRGYNEDEVDAFLQAAETTIAALERRG
jgi:DivIVA domain-containing protein